MRQFMREHIHNTCESLNTELAMSHIRTFIAVGSDARIAAIRLGAELNANSWVIDRKSFLHFVESIQDYSIEECVQNLRVSFADAESLVPGLLSYRLFLEETAAEEVIVPNVSIREGLLISIASGVSPELQEEFYTQIIASALSLGRKYRFDEEHSLHVTKLALRLFDQLKTEHGMNRHARLLLEVAGILHDIGMFIRGSSHHKHSQYLVANSEIFGLHREDLDIVSNVVRYHRNRPPSASHVSFIALQREDRMLVLKLSAILRVADALDRPHTQRIPDLEVERQDEIVFLRSTVKKDFSAEQLALKEKADMFQDIFGYTVDLT
jgi:exopolyphosphatase / guanosine-5'-triphosphate,3'-diphosphate pyrophosphatase